jgi:hypothetical protein
VYNVIHESGSFRYLVGTCTLYDEPLFVDI